MESIEGVYLMDIFDDFTTHKPTFVRISIILIPSFQL